MSVRVTRSQPGELLKPGRKGLLWRLLERALLPGDVGIFVEHIYTYFMSVLKNARRPLMWSSTEENVPSFLDVAQHHIGQEEDK